MYLKKDIFSFISIWKPARLRNVFSRSSDNEGEIEWCVSNRSYRIPRLKFFEERRKIMLDLEKLRSTILSRHWRYTYIFLRYVTRCARPYLCKLAIAEVYSTTTTSLLKAGRSLVLKNSILRPIGGHPFGTLAGIPSINTGIILEER